MAARRKPRPKEARPDRAPLRVEVAWADVTKAEGDAFVVGHYIGVLPQNAERALDMALSGFDAASREEVDESKLVLTDLTRRGAIRGSLGDVMFFPWGERQIVLAGMGRLGTFRAPQLRTLARGLTQTLGRLMKRRTVCTVLIGSGYGNLEVIDSVSGLLSGVGEALAADPSLELGTIRIVERQLDKAYEIVGALQRAKASGVEVDVVPKPVDGHGGVISVPYAFSLMLASLAQASRDDTKVTLRGSLETLVNELPTELRKDVRKELEERGNESDLRRLGLAFRLAPGAQAKGKDFADRVSFSHDGSRLWAAAITNMTTVTARDKDLPIRWLDRLVDDLQAPVPEVAEERATRAFGHLVHPDLRERLQEGSALVLELDRSMARIPWEMVVPGPGPEPLGVQRPVARQLRTAYSPQPLNLFSRKKLRALVIGDPDDSLELAPEEAQEVAKLLADNGIEVELRIGAPDELRLGGRKGIPAADLFDIVGLLQKGEFDIVHYAGHADFRPEYPDRSGWLFKEDVLTPSKLEGMDRPPRLIVANACLSAQTSTKTGETEGPKRPAGDARLVASLADEFFKRGVADYIGTAWEVPTGSAKKFAAVLYEQLLGKRTLGEAVQAARNELYKERDRLGEFGTVWAAYQHYGDPMRRLV